MWKLGPDKPAVPWKKIDVRSIEWPDRNDLRRAISWNRIECREHRFVRCDDDGLAFFVYLHIKSIEQNVIRLSATLRACLDHLIKFRSLHESQYCFE